MNLSTPFDPSKLTGEEAASYVFARLSVIASHCGTVQHLHEAYRDNEAYWKVVRALALEHLIKGALAFPKSADVLLDVIRKSKEK